LAAAGRARRLGRAPHLGSEVLPALLGALTPDLIDKPLLYAGVYVHGRSIGHSLVFLLACVLVWAVVRRGGRRAAVPAGMWVLGIASHFVVDFADDLVRGLLTGSLVVSSWFIWPLGTPSTWDHNPRIALLPGYDGPTPLEFLAIGVALIWAWTLWRNARS